MHGRWAIRATRSPAEDAQQQGDQELVQFFQQTQQEEQQRADRAQQLLGRRLAGASNMGSSR